MAVATMGGIMETTTTIMVTTTAITAIAIATATIDAGTGRRSRCLVAGSFGLLALSGCALLEDDFPPEEPLTPAQAEERAAKLEIQQRAQAGRGYYEARVGGRGFDTWP